MIMEPTISPKARAAATRVRRSRCLVCAKPSVETICDSCRAHIQGEAIERKRREEKPGHRGLSI